MPERQNTREWIPFDVPAAQECIRRLCQLHADVVRVIDPLHHRPADCFCGESGFWPLSSPSDYRNDGHALEFIERAVHAAIDAKEPR